MGFLQQLDTDIFLFFNGMHCNFADNFMWLISGKFSSLAIVATCFALLKTDWKKMLTLIVAIALVVLLADRISSGIIKPLVERLRPSHNPEISQLVHIVNDYRGGTYGFVSSHAANIFGVAALISLVIRNRQVWLYTLSWAALVSYSRIYLGVHYPGDVVCGAIIGILVALVVFWAWRKVAEKKPIPAPDTFYDPAQGTILAIIVVTNVATIAAMALF